jgi:hypothetical protein
LLSLSVVISSPFYPQIFVLLLLDCNFCFLFCIQFVVSGNFGFGIDEHIDLGLKYDPGTGIFGMDFYVVLGRPGFRVGYRKHKHGRIGKNQRVTRDEAIQWFKTKYQGNVTGTGAARPKED